MNEEVEESFEKRCELPYAVEYAKSNRSTCKGCKRPIEANTLRFSAREPSRYFDGFQDNWFHDRCFWPKLKFGKDKINENSIKGLEWTKWDDQEKIREKIETFKLQKINSSKKYSFSQITVEHSATNRGKCSSCAINFECNEMKVKLLSGKWQHAKCLFAENKEHGDNVTEMKGWSELNDREKQHIESLTSGSQENTKPVDDDDDDDDCVIIDEIIAGSSKPVVVAQPEEPLQKRQRLSFTGDVRPTEKTEKEKRKERLKAQSAAMWTMHEKFNEMFTIKEMTELLKENNVEPPKGADMLLKRLVDCAVFGKPAVCPKCYDKVIYSNSSKTYVCLGYVSEFTKCVYSCKNPTRSPFALPMKFMKKFPILREMKINESSARKERRRNYRRRIRKSIIDGERFPAFGKKVRLELQYLIERLYTVDDDEALNYDAKASFNKFGARTMRRAEEAFEGGVKSIKSVGKSKQIIKKGTVVDSEFSAAEDYHVFKDDTGLYSAALSLTDISCNKNSYYKMQLLKHDFKESFALFRSWGRVGTSVGGSKEEILFYKEAAIDSFKAIFLEKTGNEWENRNYFRKFAGKMNMVETDYQEFEETATETVAPGSKTQLPQSVKEVILSIFDVEKMKATMLSFELDIDKMPLGKLSRNQVMSAYHVLTDLQTILESKNPSQDHILDVTNKFYTYIPHNFGMKEPELLSNFEILKKKTEMLDTLLEIQYAYETVREGGQQTMTTDPVDVHYNDLKCTMTPLDHSSVEFLQLSTYLQNSHGSTHVMDYDLLDIIRLEKEGEAQKFKASIGERKLLWHGSLRMNYASILGKGLRIAPPEAPVSGYMFGKGIYFADMFTKSCFYCRAAPNDEAYLLLCDVAIGSQKEENFAVGHSEKTIGQYNSVKGLGREFPDPACDFKHPDGYTIPLGRPLKRNIGKHGIDYSLLYNEYIVYNVDQVKMRYLVRIRVKQAQHRM